jgi:hypothetical protein
MYTIVLNNFNLKSCPHLHPHTMHMGYLNSHCHTNHMGFVKSYSFLNLYQTLSYNYDEINALPLTTWTRCATNTLGALPKQLLPEKMLAFHVGVHIVMVISNVLMLIVITYISFFLFIYYLFIIFWGGDS